DALVSHNQLNVAFPWYILATRYKLLPRCAGHMEGNMKAPQIWLAVLRIVVGAWFLKAVWTKLTVEFAWGVVPYLAVSSRFLGFQPKRVAEFANGNPVLWYRQFLEDTVLPHARLFANLQAYGEVAVGLGVLLGLGIGLTALVGLFLTLNYALATQWMSFGQQGFHVLLITAMIMFLGTRAGRVWGLDGLILRMVSPRRRRWLSLIMVLTVFVLLPLSADIAAAQVHVCVTTSVINHYTPGTLAHLNGRPDLMCGRVDHRDGAVQAVTGIEACTIARQSQPPHPFADGDDGFRRQRVCIHDG